jgi:CheY-like chemotaxis protein
MDMRFKATRSGGDSIQPAPENLEFLVVCNDYAVLKAITSSIQKLRGRLNCAPSAVSAKEYIARRKIDGIIMDMSVPGSMELVRTVRKGSSNKVSIVFACAQTSAEAGSAIQAGANYVVRKPVTDEKMFQTLSTAAAMMAAEKRRYFRYPLMVPVDLVLDGKETRATMSNLSEGGMAVLCMANCPMGSNLQFAFELPFGGPIHGKGSISWANSEGLIGIQFTSLHESAYTHLSDWISRRELKTGP